MTSYEHGQLVKRITALDSCPEDEVAFQKWLEAEEIIKLLRENAQSDELIIHLLTDYFLIHSLVVSRETIYPLDKRDLLQWNGSPYNRISANYTLLGDQYAISREADSDEWSSASLAGSRSLVFGREYQNKTYFEILQEYTHLAEVYWFPEENSYCRYDENGDLVHAVSITNNHRGINLISCNSKPLNLYLKASNSVLVRLFDFTPHRGTFEGWPDTPEDDNLRDESLFYVTKIGENESYHRGVQIIQSLFTKDIISPMIKRGWYRSTEGDSIELGKTVQIEHLETIFYSPEVLSKYKSDYDKYSLEDHFLSCRGGWGIPYGVNDAGQVYVYAIDLQKIPVREQKYWTSFNEEAKAGISQRSIATDFEVNVPTPDSLEKILSIVRRWAESVVPWWRLRNPVLLYRVRTPRTDSTKEWAEEFKSLHDLIIDGFELDYIREHLRKRAISFQNSDKSLVLLEKMTSVKFDGLRTTRTIRSKIAAHVQGAEGRKLTETVRREHDSYAAHFHSVCDQIEQDLVVIEQHFS